MPQSHSSNCRQNTVGGEGGNSLMELHQNPTASSALISLVKQYDRFVIEVHLLSFALSTTLPSLLDQYICTNRIKKPNNWQISRSWNRERPYCTSLGEDTLKKKKKVERMQTQERGRKLQWKLHATQRDPVNLPGGCGQRRNTEPQQLRASAPSGE